MTREQLIKSEEYLEVSIDSALYQSKKKSVQIEFIIDFIKGHREEYAKLKVQEELRKIKKEIEGEFVNRYGLPKCIIEIIDKHILKG